MHSVENPPKFAPYSDARRQLRMYHIKTFNAMSKKVNVTAKVGETRTITMIDNDASRKAKNNVKEYFGNYETQLRVQWNGLKDEDTAFKALNNVISGIAGGEGEKPYIWLIKHFSRYATADGMPCNRFKDEDGKVYYKLATLSGVTARGLLKKSALNCIESQRIGNRFEQTVVVPVTKK